MRDQTTQNKNPNEMLENGSAKLAHKIFVHRLIFNWNFFNGFNVYIKLIYIFFYFRLALAMLFSFALNVAFLFLALFFSLFFSSFHLTRELCSIFVMVFIGTITTFCCTPLIFYSFPSLSNCYTVSVWPIRFSFHSSLLLFSVDQHFFCWTHSVILFSL